MTDILSGTPLADRFVPEPSTREPIMAIDIGGGTQDVVLYDPAQPLENAVKLVLPAPTVVAARRIAAATVRSRPVFLTGVVMGGGAVARAVRQHLRAGLPVYCQAEAALTLHDNLDRVLGLGVTIVETAPEEDVVEVVLGDLDLAALGQALALFEIQPPAVTALAIQDHGFSPTASNRLTRFAQWRRFLDGGGELGGLLYASPPAELTRWRAATRAGRVNYFMDTAAAALRGALLDETAAALQDQGLVVVNVGNEHTVAFLVRGRVVHGVYEHHTELLDARVLADHLDRFRLGLLTHDEVFDGWGHGLAYHRDYRFQNPFESVVVTGPRRRLAKGLGHMAAPFGEMMLSGSFGLIQAVAELSGNNG